MKTAYTLRIATLTIAAATFLPPPIIAAPMHTHCDVVAWTESFIVDNTRAGYAIPPGGLDYKPGGNAGHFTDFQFETDPRTTPPLSGNANCFYEISDITRIDILFEFTGMMTWESLKVSGGSTGTFIDATFENAPPFSSGVATSFTFRPHSMGVAAGAGPIELSLPNQAVFTRVINDNNGFVITKAEIMMFGNHYYIAEPSTALLVLAGLSIFLRRRSK